MITSTFPMLIYVITDRSLRPDLDPLDLMVRAARCGADMIQVREKDLSGGALLRLARWAVEAGGSAVYVNQRVDVALASAAAGVHLPADGLPGECITALWPGRLRIGASAHGPGEAVAAERAGASFIVCGPVYDTPSKRRFGPPIGLERARASAAAVRVPVLAIGGIHEGNVREAARPPLAGVAMISAIMKAPSMEAAVSRVREAAA